MSVTNPLDSLQRNAPEATLLGELADRLEAAWREGPTTDLGKFVPPPGAPSRLPLLRAVVQGDLQIAWRSGQPRTLEQYLKRYPELGPAQQLSPAMIFVEYQARRQAGEDPSPEDFKRRFPNQYNELARLISAAGNADTADEQQITRIPGEQQQPGSQTEQDDELEPTLLPTRSPLSGRLSGQPAPITRPAGPWGPTSNPSADDASTPEPPGDQTGQDDDLEPTRRPAPIPRTDREADDEREPTLQAPKPSASRRAPAKPAASTRPGAPRGAGTGVQPGADPHGDAPALPPTAVSQVLPVSEGYKLFKRIGRGQFGEVFLAEAPGGVNVAVKRIFRSLDDESSQRELQSLQLIRELRHPFLLQTQAFWSLEDRLVIVMELADDSLADWNREARREGGEGIPVADLLVYFRGAAAALDYLHGMNVIHRDVKPANLLRLKGYPKVADFGLARMMENQQASATFCGTPLYMAPEVWKKKVCAASDQYSLAATYAEMRLGRPIYSGTDYVEICLQHASGKPDLGTLEKDEQRVLLRALARDPEERFPTCSAFAEALTAVLAPPPQAAPARRGPAALIAAVSLGLIALVAVAFGLWMFLTPAPTTQVGQQPSTSPLVPAGFLPEGDDKDGRYFKRIRYPLSDGTSILFLLIGQSTDQAPFYIMRDKVSNRQFNTVVKEKRMSDLLDQEAKARPWAISRKWNDDGGDAPDKTDLPVFYVTFSEARCFAHFLGGELPTEVQWDKAAGRYDGADGPFPPGATPKAYAKALGDKPFPVGDPNGDETMFGCRDMADNGREWTIPAELINLPDFDKTKMILLRGISFMGGEAYRFKNGKALAEITKPRLDIGFRVVAEAPREQP
jgi:serine/threonine protein kinase